MLKNAVLPILKDIRKFSNQGKTAQKLTILPTKHTGAV